MCARARALARACVGVSVRAHCHSVPASPIFNQLLAALRVLILCSMTKMSTCAPDASHSLKEMNYAVNGCPNVDDVNRRKKFIQPPAMIAYLRLKSLSG